MSFQASLSLDELEQLAQKTNVPARFSDYVPEFSVEEKQFVFNHANGPQTETIWLIKDGVKYLGYVRRQKEIAEGIRILGFSPESLEETFELTSGRLHYETEKGAVFQTCMGGIPEEASYEFKKGIGTLELTRSHNGQTNRFVFRIDPVFGYCVDGEFRLEGRSEEKFKLAKAAVMESFSPWKHLSRYHISVYTPQGRPGMEGFYNNMLAFSKIKSTGLRKGGFAVRDKGFVAFIEKNNGWGAAFSPNTGENGLNMKHCDAHNVWHLFIPWPENKTIKQKLRGIPPELASYMLSNTEVSFQDQTLIQIRIGKKENFGDQPLPGTTSERGLFIKNDPPELDVNTWLTAGKSLHFTKTHRPHIPQIALDTNSTYRLKAVLKSEPETQAWIEGRTYEWSPKNQEKWFDVKQTAKVGEQDGWKEIEFEISTSQWDPFLEIGFICQGKGFWLDSFEFTKA